VTRAPHHRPRRTARTTLTLVVVALALIVFDAGPAAGRTTQRPPTASPRVVAVADSGPDTGTDPNTGTSPGPGPEPATSPDPGPETDPGTGSDPEPPVGGDDNVPGTAVPPGPTPADAAAAAAEAAAADRAAADRAAAAEAAERKQAAAEAAAERRAANAVRRAEHLRTAATSAVGSWDRIGRPDQLVVVRARNIDIVSMGRLSARLARPAGAPLTLAGLARTLPPGWLTIGADGAAALSAALVLGAGTDFDIGPGVRSLVLTGGPTAALAASIWVGHAHLRIQKVDIGSRDPATGHALPASAPGRPFIVANNGATLDITDATVHDLGSLPPSPPAPVVPGAAPVVGAGAAPVAGAGAPTRPGGAPRPVPGHAGVVYGQGSTGTVLRSSLTTNAVGLKLAGSRGVVLDTVTVDSSVGDGLVLHGDVATTLRSVHADHNGRNGVTVSGPSTDRPITAITTEANGGFGVLVAGQTRPSISALATRADGAGGLRLAGTTAGSVTNSTMTDEPIGVLVNGTATGSQLADLRIRGGQQGIVLTHQVTGVSITRTAVTDSSRRGVSVAGTAVALDDLSVTGATTGLRITSAAHSVTVTGGKISGGRDGIAVTARASEVVLRDPTIGGVDHDAIINSAAGTQIVGATITGATTGIEARQPTILTGATINGVNEGVHVSGAGTLNADRVDVLATNSGIKIDSSAPVRLTDSRIRARKALRGPVTLLGTNTISPPPLNWIGAFGVLFVLLALLLEALAVFRQYRLRTRRPVPAPAAPRPAPVATPEPETLPVPVPAIPGRRGGSEASTAKHRLREYATESPTSVLAVVPHQRREPPRPAPAADTHGAEPGGSGRAGASSGDPRLVGRGR
jgi:Periplasmic copper-binding protein (NosD)